MTRLICGVDEAGRGPLAGPVVAAAVVFPEDYKNVHFRDSKKLSPKKRDILFREVQQEARSWAIVAVGPRRIDKLNILQASLLAMSLAAQRVEAHALLVDGNKTIQSPLPQKAVVKGDDLHVQISAASILAKVWRDRLMVKLGEKYPGYGLEGHAGYPTQKHRQAIAQLGPSPVHRRTFRGVKEFCHLS